MYPNAELPYQEGSGIPDLVVLSLLIDLPLNSYDKKQHPPVTTF